MPVLWLLLAIAAAVPVLIWAQAPAWWSQRNVTTPNTSPDDFSAANVGQLKHIATQAAAELNAAFAGFGGAGYDINTLIAGWNQSPTPGIPRDDFAALNQGQLKTVAKLL